MKGSYHIVVQNNRVKFEFDIRRNITIVRGDSATGKTTLIAMIDTYDRLGLDSGIEVACNRRCLTLNNANWEAILDSISECIVFIDEENTAIKTVEFARRIRDTDNYYVIVTRENLPNLPYSVEEIYGIHNSGRYADLRKTYNSFYRLYSLQKDFDTAVSQVIVEDSNAGFEFYNHMVGEGVRCFSANGKTNIRKMLDQNTGIPTLVIADGAAFGSEIGELYLLMQRRPDLCLYLPESFEWIILSSGLIDGKRIEENLKNPEDYIESRDCFSWEQFFTKLLVQETVGTYLQYSKHKLNDNYLNTREKAALLEVIRVISNIINSGEH